MIQVVIVASEGSDFQEGGVESAKSENGSLIRIRLYRFLVFCRDLIARKVLKIKRRRHGSHFDDN